MVKITQITLRTKLNLDPTVIWLALDKTNIPIALVKLMLVAYIIRHSINTASYTVFAEMSTQIREHYSSLFPLNILQRV